MTQIVNTFDNNDNLCGYYPDLVRKYVYDKILAYYSNVFGIKNSKYVDILKCILKQQQYSIPNIHLLEKASDNFQNITSGKVSDILKKTCKDIDSEIITIMINDLIKTYNPEPESEPEPEPEPESSIVNYLIELNNNVTGNAKCEDLNFVFAKVYLIQYFTNDSFKNIFGFNYDYFSHNSFKSSYVENTGLLS